MAALGCPILFVREACYGPRAVDRRIAKHLLYVLIA